MPFANFSSTCDDLPAHSPHAVAGALYDVIAISTSGLSLRGVLSPSVVAHAPPSVATALLSVILTCRVTLFLPKAVM